MLMAEGQAFLHFERVVEADFETLAALREAALRESLERLGLFSQERSRATEGIVHGDGDGSCRHDGTNCRLCDGVGGDDRGRHFRGIIKT